MSQVSFEPDGAPDVPVTPLPQIPQTPPQEIQDDDVEERTP